MENRNRIGKKISIKTHYAVRWISERIETGNRTKPQEIFRTGFRISKRTFFLAFPVGYTGLSG